MVKQRLQKIISSAGICSRRKSETLLRDSRISINGTIAKIGDLADPALDIILLDGKPIKITYRNKVFLINKPVGILSSCHDDYGRRTVVSLIPSKHRQGIYPVGRLDLNSRGAMILTNNGELTLRLSHPRYLHSKTYQVWLQGILSKDSLNKWRSGIMLDGRKTMPARVELLETNQHKSLIKVVLNEGRNRQIRRIAEQLGNPVLDLQRVAIAHIKLNDLKEGHWREVNEKEYRPILHYKNVTNKG